MMSAQLQLLTLSSTEIDTDRGIETRMARVCRPMRPDGSLAQADNYDMWMAAFAENKMQAKETKGAFQSYAVSNTLERTRIFVPAVSRKTSPIFSTVAGLISSPILASSSPSSSSSAASIVATPPVFENAYFTVRASKLGGLGAFARVDIDVGTVIHEEAPLFKCEMRNIFHAYEALSREDQARYLALHHWGGDKDYPIIGIFTTNRFHLGPDRICGIFPDASRFNHACTAFRTCAYAFSEEKQQMIFMTAAVIEKGDEITISYGPPDNLYAEYGFVCRCLGCVGGETHKEMEEKEKEMEKEMRMQEKTDAAQSWQKLVWTR